MKKGTIEGKWEWASHSSSPITGRRVYYNCAAHVDCEVRLCLQEQEEEADDQVVAAIDLSKEHGAEARTKKRGRTRPSPMNKRRKSSSSQHVRHDCVILI